LITVKKTEVITMSASRRPIPSRSKEPTLPPSKKRGSASPLRRALTAYGIRHAQAVLFSLGQISRAPFTTLMIFIVMGIALALPAGLFVVLKNASLLNQSWQGQSPIVLYLKLPAIDSESLALLNQIQARPEVEKVDYVSPEQGLADFEKQSGFTDTMGALRQNPLPAVLVVTPKVSYQSPAAVETLLNSLKTLPQVDSAKLDLGWVQRLDGLLKLAVTLAYGLTALLACGVVLITGSTIHLALQSHQNEIGVYQLLGATDGFIRRPFLYRGALYGLAGGIVAWLITMALLIWLTKPTAEVAKLYSSAFSLQGLGIGGSFALLLLGATLGWIGAGIAVYQYRTRI